MEKLMNPVRKQVNKPLRIAILGIGHELCGDDAAGLMVVRGLHTVSGDDLLIIDAGSAPENFTGKLREFAPDVLIVVDAVQMNEPPGTVRLLGLGAAEPYSATTHTLSPHLMIDYLRASLDCDMLLLGIQPKQDAFGSGLSPDVQHSIDEVVQVLDSVCDCDNYHN